MDKIPEEKLRQHKITVLICTLNEEDNLPYVLPFIPDWVDEVLLIDGHSTDKTVEVAQSLLDGVKVIYQKGKGKGDALKTGIENATGDIIVTLDADGATDPRLMLRFVEPLLDGYDFCKGSRFSRGYPRQKVWYRVMGNLFITLLFDVLFWKKYTDLCSGYNAFWTETTRSVLMPWPSDGFENEPMINSRISRHGLKVKEIGYREEERLNGQVKEESWRQGIKAIKSIVRERFNG